MTELSRASLDDATILAHVGPRSFARGRQYARRNAVFDGRVQGPTLLAKCAGNEADFYHVRATIEDAAIGRPACTCHVGASGTCKHVAAMLLTYLWSPDAFLPIEPFDVAMTRYDRSDLLALIQHVIVLAPDMEAMVEAPARGRASHVDANAYRRQVAMIFARAAQAQAAQAPPHAPHRPAGPPAGALALVRAAHGARQARAWDRAAAIYRALFVEGIDNYESFADADGRLDRMLGECGDGLAACLAEKGWEPQLRLDAIRALIDGFHFGIAFHQLPARETLASVLLSRTSRPELERAIEWAREESRAARGGDKTAWGRLLLRLEGDFLDDNAYLALCRETGCFFEQVERLLERERADEAFEAAQAAPDSQLVSTAELFARAGYSDRAEAWIADRASVVTTPSPLVWLSRRLASRGDAAGATEYAIRAFRMHPSRDMYRLAKAAATPAGQWAVMRGEMLAFVDALPSRAPLSAELLLDDGEVERAVDVALDSLRSPLSSDAPVWQEAVARVAATAHPRGALAIYRQCVERLVERRGRANYVEATVLVEIIHNLYKGLDDEAGWRAYIAQTRETHRRLRALLEELDAAGIAGE